MRQVQNNRNHLEPGGTKIPIYCGKIYQNPPKTQKKTPKEKGNNKGTNLDQTQANTHTQKAK